MISSVCIMSDTVSMPPWERCYYMKPGYLMPTSTNTAENIKKFEVRDDDIFIVTYPRSGTYWTTTAVRAMLTIDKTTLEVDRQVIGNPWYALSVGPFPDQPQVADGITRYNQNPSPREIGSHLLPDMLPTQYHQKKPKTIYVQRNPKDAAVSNFKMHSGTHFVGNVTCWQLFYEEFLKGNVEFGSYFEHVKQWSKYKDESWMLWIKYEDMKQDRRSVYQKIAAFLDRPLSEEEMDVVMHVTDVNYMKENAAVVEDMDVFLEKGVNLVKQGQVGNWKDMFTVAQNEEFDKVYNEQMVGYEEFKYSY